MLAGSRDVHRKTATEKAVTTSHRVAVPAVPGLRGIGLHEGRGASVSP